MREEEREGEGEREGEEERDEEGENCPITNSQLPIPHYEY
jgi:hypothetical protein